MTWPFENDTSQVAKKLTKRSLKANRKRNLFLIMAIALTCFITPGRMYHSLHRETICTRLREADI